MKENQFVSGARMVELFLSDHAGEWVFTFSGQTLSLKYSENMIVNDSKMKELPVSFEPYEVVAKQGSVIFTLKYEPVLYSDHLSPIVDSGVKVFIGQDLYFAESYYSLFSGFKLGDRIEGKPIFLLRGFYAVGFWFQEDKVLHYAGPGVNFLSSKLVKTRISANTNSSRLFPDFVFVDYSGRDEVASYTYEEASGGQESDDVPKLLQFEAIQLSIYQRMFNDDLSFMGGIKYLQYLCLNWTVEICAASLISDSMLISDFVAKPFIESIRDYLEAGVIKTPGKLPFELLERALDTLKKSSLGRYLLEYFSASEKNLCIRSHGKVVKLSSNDLTEGNLLQACYLLSMAYLLHLRQIEPTEVSFAAILIALVNSDLSGFDEQGHIVGKTAGKDGDKRIDDVNKSNSGKGLAVADGLLGFIGSLKRVDYISLDAVPTGTCFLAGLDIIKRDGIVDHWVVLKRTNRSFEVVYDPANFKNRGRVIKEEYIVPALLRNFDFDRSGVVSLLEGGSNGGLA